MSEATGGTERTVLEVARIQQRRGFDVTIASRGDEYWQGLWENVRLLRLTPSPWTRALTFGKITGVHLPLTSLIHREKFDLIHLHEYLKTALFEHYPKVMHFHNDPLPGCDAAVFAQTAPAYWAQVGKSLRQIGVSEYLARRLHLAHDLAGEDASEANIVRVPNGVHANAIPPQARAEARKQAREKLGLKDADVVFLFAGAMRPEKGVEFLARAFARLSEDNPNARLIMVGGGRLWIEQGWLRSNPLDAMEREVAEILKPAIAQRRALLLGIVPPAEIMPYYAASDVLVLPSMFQETFGLVILEAFSVGLPVIAFRSGGIPELVEDRRNGIILEQGDEEALYRAMRELTLDRALRERLGAAGERTAQLYSWENTADQIEAAYQGALETRSRRAASSTRSQRNHSRATQ